MSEVAGRRRLAQSRGSLSNIPNHQSGGHFTELRSPGRTSAGSRYTDAKQHMSDIQSESQMSTGREQIGGLTVAYRQEVGYGRASYETDMTESDIGDMGTTGSGAIWTR